MSHLLACCSAAFAFAIAVGSAEALDRHVTIVNETSVDIVEFYGSQVDAKDWQEDILGSKVLSAGSSVSINFDDGTGYCMFDFRAVFADGDVLVRNKINVCEVGTYRYHE
jgi:hypothetical protein